MWAPLLLCLCSGITSQNLDHRFFLMQIIEKYGENGSITYEGFERLYKNLGLGNTHSVQSQSHHHESDSMGKDGFTDSDELADETPENKPLLSRASRGINLPTEKDISEEQLASLVDEHEEVTMVAPSSRVSGPPRCLAPAQILAVYGVPRSGEGMSPVSFLHLCPAIIYQLDQGSCGHRKSAIIAEEAVASTHSSWFFALLTTLAISVSGFLVVAVVPLLPKVFISKLISFLVSLAVGTLLGDAFLHLIPHALESHDHGEHQSHTGSVLKTGVMFLTVVFFFTFEAVLNIKRREKVMSNKQENTSYMPVNVGDHQMEKEMMQLGVDACPSPPALTTVEGHSHSHSNTATMVVMGDGLHNLTDGLAIGAAFSGGLAPGFATAVAVFTHELPHELGDFAVLLQSGMSVRKALIYNVISSALSLFGTVVGLVVGNFGDATRWIYAVTASSFIYIALSNLVPEMNKQKSSFSTIFLRVIGILCGGTIMGFIALFEHDMQNLFS